MSPDVNNPAFRALSYDELATSYQQQMEAMLEGGVDAILIETIFDTLNAKAAIFAAGQAMKVTGIEVPVMLSVTVSDIGGRTLSGQTLEAFLASVQHANIFSVGLNCSFGARQLNSWLRVHLIISVLILMRAFRIVWGNMIRLPQIWLMK